MEMSSINFLVISPYLSFFSYIFSNFSHIISLELVCDDIGIIGIILSISATFKNINSNINIQLKNINGEIESLKRDKIIIQSNFVP